MIVGKERKFSDIRQNSYKELSLDDIFEVFFGEEEDEVGDI